MSKKKEYADGGSFFRRPSSFLEIPEFQRTTPDIPDIQSILAFAQSPRAPTVRAPAKRQVFDSTNPGGKALGGRSRYRSVTHNRGLESIYDKVNSINGYSGSIQHEQDVQRLKNDAIANAQADEREQKAFDLNRQDQIANSKNIYTGDTGDQLYTRFVNPEGDEPTGIHPISLADYIQDQESSRENGTAPRYARPMNEQQYLDEYDQNLSYGSLDPSSPDYVPVYSRPHKATQKQAYDFVGTVMNPAASGGFESIGYTTMVNLGVNPKAVTNRPETLFQAIGETRKDNASKLNAAMQMLAMMPTDVRNWFKNDWVNKIVDGTYTGTEKTFFQNLVKNAAQSRINTSISVDSPKVGTDDGGGGGDILGFFAQLTTTGGYLAEDGQNETEEFWVFDKSSGKQIKTKRNVTVFAAPASLKNALGSEKERDQLATGSDYNRRVYVGGTLIDFAGIANVKDPGHILGLKYVAGLDGQNGSLYKIKLVYVDENIDPQAIYQWKPDITEEEKGTLKREPLTAHQLARNAYLVGNGYPIGKYDGEGNWDGGPNPKVKEDPVFESGWVFSDGLRQDYKTKSVFKTISNERADDYRKRWGFPNELIGNNEITAIQVLEPMTLQDILALGLDQATQEAVLERLGMKMALGEQSKLAKLQAALEKNSK